MIKFGIIKSISDPLKLGRVKVSVFDIHDNIRDVDLAWSQVMMPGNTPAVSGQGHSVNLNATVLYTADDELPTGKSIGDVKIFGTLVCGIFLDDTMQEFMVMGTLPTKTEGIEDNNIRVRAGSDPNAEDPVGLYQPPSTYAPVYPYNNVYATESGHCKEYDDTPGAERITERHKSGTRYEIDPNGTKNETIVRDNYQLVAGHDTLEVYGNVKIVVGGDADIAIAGSLSASVTGNITADSAGDITLKAIEADKKIILNGNVDILKNLKVTGTTHVAEDQLVDSHTHLHSGINPSDPLT
jgi:hypothetical protein